MCKTGVRMKWNKYGDAPECTLQGIWSLNWWLFMLLLLRAISVIINIAYLAAESLPRMWANSPLLPSPTSTSSPHPKVQEVEKAIAGNSIIILEQIKSIGVNKASFSLTTAAPQSWSSRFLWPRPYVVLFSTRFHRYKAIKEGEDALPFSASACCNRPSNK